MAYSFKKKQIKSAPYLSARPGHLPAWVATWSEYGKGRESKSFTYGSSRRAQYSSSSEAYKAAAVLQNQKRKENGQLLQADFLQLIYDSSKDIVEAANKLGLSVPTVIHFTNELEINKRPQGYNKPKLGFTGAQCRHAREYLNYTRDELCEVTGVSKTSLRCFELGKSTPRITTFNKLRDFFTTRNIIFSSDEGAFIVLSEG